MRKVRLRRNKSKRRDHEICSISCINGRMHGVTSAHRFEVDGSHGVRSWYTKFDLARICNIT